MRYAIIRNRETDRNAAVVLHDPDAPFGVGRGRLVCKVRPADWPLQQSFDAWADREIIVQEVADVGGHRVTRRRKIVRTDADFLGHFIDKFVRRPYEVRKEVRPRTHSRIDSLADQVAAEALGG